MKPCCKYLWPILIVISAFVVMVLLIKLRPAPEVNLPAQPLLLVEGLRVYPQDIPLAVHSQGTVQPQLQSTITAEIAGRIIEVSPAYKVGGFFAQGELLLKIDPSDYQAILAQREAELAQSELKLAQQLAEAEQAKEEWDKLGEGKASRLVLREPYIREARADVAADRASVAQAQRDLDRTVVTAPYPGRVKKKWVDLGQYVVGGGLGGTPLVDFYSTKHAEVRLPLTDRELSYLDASLVYSDRSDTDRLIPVQLIAYQGNKRYTWQGEIDRAEGFVDPRTRLNFVVARVADPYRYDPATSQFPLKVGQYVEATIAGRTVANAYRLPRQGLRDEDTVLIIDEDNRLWLRKVSVLKTEADQVIIANGLNPGDIVCLSPIDYIVEGVQVELALTSSQDQRTPGNGQEKAGS